LPENYNFFMGNIKITQQNYSVSFIHFSAKKFNK
jgi:hypothetical protein